MDSDMGSESIIRLIGVSGLKNSLAWERVGKGRYLRGPVENKSCSRALRNEKTNPTKQSAPALLRGFYLFISTTDAFQAVHVNCVFAPGVSLNRKHHEDHSP